MPAARETTSARFAVGLGGADGRHVYVYQVNPNAANYDSPGRAVLWMDKNCYFAGSASAKAHETDMVTLARHIAEILTAHGLGAWPTLDRRQAEAV